MIRPETSTRFIGWCPVCQRDIKVRSGLLVHHGYQRPGVGYIIGDCPGVGYEPYETGTGAADAYLKDIVLPQLSQAQWNLQVLTRPEGPPWLVFEQYDVATRRVIRDPRTGAPETIRLSHTDANARAAELPGYDRDRYSWDRQLRIAIAQTESEIEFWGREQARIERLIRDWQPQPLRTIEQEIERQRQSRSEREAEREAARNQKIQAEVVKIQKRIDAAVRNRNMRTLADIYSSHKLVELSGWRMHQNEALALLDRDHVWAAFGLIGPSGYLEGEAAKEALEAMRYGRRVPSDHPGVRFDYAPLPWPPELGAARIRRR